MLFTGICAISSGSILSLFNFALSSFLFPHCLMLRFVLLMLSLFNVAFCFAHFIIVSCCPLFCWIFSSLMLRFVR
jgi:hypothetical protein